jgi:hypothetical protein
MTTSIPTASSPLVTVTTAAWVNEDELGKNATDPVKSARTPFAAKDERGAVMDTLTR